MEHDYLECQCNLNAHQIRIGFDNDPTDPGLWLDVQLCQYRNVFRRIWAALRYVFKKHDDYGHWDTHLLSEEGADKLKTYINQYKTLLREQNK